jgi:hypothetical protein
MPTISSTDLQVNVAIEGAAPDATLVITADANRPLAIGAYTFQLRVVDDSRNVSEPVQVRLIVVDTTAPSAVISAPRTVPFGQNITLSGAESRDVGGGTIAQYIWTLIQ